MCLIIIWNDKTLTNKCNKLKTFRDTTKLFYNVYDYDSSGNRIKKVRYNGSGTALETIKYYYDDSGKLIHQKVDSYISSITHNESLSFMYDELGKLYGFIYNNEKYYYIKNIFNTILGIVDSTGNVVVQYNYDAWGNILSVEDNSTDLIGSINPFRYKGYYYDSDIEMYYCKARYYVPLWKRWLTPDNPKYLDENDINNLNLFVYCENNPVNGYDPNGDFPIKVILTILDVAVCIVINVLNAKKSGYDVSAAVKSGFVYGLLESLSANPLSSFFIGVLADIDFQKCCEGKSFKKINLNSALWSGIISGITSCPGHYLGKLICNYSDVSKALVESLNNMPFSFLGNSVSLLIQKLSKEYTIDDLYEDLTGKKAPITPVDFFI